MCYCLDAQGRGLIKFEKIAGKEVFEMPFKVEDLKTMFGDDAQIFTQFFWWYERRKPAPKRQTLFSTSKNRLQKSFRP